MKKPLLFLISILFMLVISNAQSFQDYLDRGDSCIKVRDFSQAISNYKKALDLKPERLLESKEDVLVLSKLGYAYSDIADYQTSLEYLFKYLEKDAVKENDSLLSGIYNVIGTNYHYLSKPKQALNFYEKSVEVAGSNIKMLGGLYNNMANIYQQLDSLELATEYYETALNYFNDLGDYDGRLVINMNIGVVELQANKIKSALNYFTEAKKLAEENKDTMYLIMVYINLGEFYTKMTDYDKAENYLAWALDKAIDLKSLMLIKESYRSLVDLNESKNDYEKAFKYLELYKANSDSMFNQKTSMEYAELEARFSLREKEKENSLLKKEQQFSTLRVKSQRKYIWLLSGLVLLSVIFIGLFYIQRRKIGKSKKILESQNKEIKKSQKQLKDLNFQYEKLIEKYEGGGPSKRESVDLS